MFGKRFTLSEETLPIVEEIGKHMPGGFFIYKAAGEKFWNDKRYKVDAIIESYNVTF